MPPFSEVKLFGEENFVPPAIFKREQDSNPALSFDGKGSRENGVLTVYYRVIFLTENESVFDNI